MTLRELQVRSQTQEVDHEVDIVERRAPDVARISSWNSETLTFEAVLATESARVARWDFEGEFDEILDLRASAKNLPDRVPALDNHRRTSMDDRIGTVENVKEVSGELRGLFKLSRSNPRAQRLADDIADGHPVAISVGYRITETTDRKNPKTGRREKIVTIELVEASVVNLPADPNAKARNKNMDPKAEPKNPERTRATAPSVGNPPAPAADARASAAETQTRAEANAAIRSIAEIAGLDAAWANTQIDAETPVDEVRAAAFDEMRRRSAASAQIRATSIEVTANHDDPEQRIQAAGEAVYARYTPGHQLSERARQFAGFTLLDLAREALRERGMSHTGLSAADTFQRALHSTSDFPLILADPVGRTLREAYAAAQSGLKMVARQTTAKDFRSKHRIQLSEAPRLEKVNESGEFTHGSLAEAEESYRLTTYGKIIAISRQAMINDDLGAFVDFARRMGQAAAATEGQLLVDMLISGSGNGPTMSDGKALFHADHKNKASSGAAPDVTTLSAARTAMRRQAGLKGELIDVSPRYVVVPPELETSVEQLLTTLAATKADDVNPFPGKLALVVEPRLTSAAHWYVVADPASIDGLEYAYLEGEEGVQIETKAGFEVDGVQIKARLDFGAGFVDWRGWYANAGQ